MNAQDLVGLLPIIVVAGAGVVLMLVISFQRSYCLAWWVTLAGLFASLLVVPVAWDNLPRQITPLIVIDEFALFFSAVLLMTGGVVLVLCYDYFRNREGENEELFLLILFALLGGVVLASSNHFASFFIGLETLSVSLFALIAYPVKEKKSLEAAVKYLVLSGVSSAFLLFGAALIYAELGSFAFAEIGRILNFAENQSYSLIGVIMLVVALGFKLSLVPFHMWTSDVYEGAPAPITAFVATVSKGAIFALLLRYFVEADAFRFEGLYPVLYLIAILTIFGGNLLALLQTNIKRLLAYSSIAHLGYVLVAFAAGMFTNADLVVESVIFYLVAYIITTLGAFGVIVALSTSEREADSVEDLTGLFWKHPLCATLFTVMLMSLAGIPLTAGFVGKFYVFVAGVDSQLWALLLAVVAGSGIGLYYYLRMVVEMAKQPAAGLVGEAKISGQSGTEIVLLSLLTVVVFWLGIQPRYFIEVINGISKGFG